MKFYYFLNSVNQTNYNYLIEKLELLKNGYTCENIITKFFYKIGDGDKNKGRINFGFFIDVLTFIEYIKEKHNIGYTDILNKIEFIHLNKNFYIFNKDIYIENNIINSYEKINLDNKTYFITSIDPWLNPFFIILYKLSKLNKNLYVIRSNKRKGWIYNDDKINNISKLYKKGNKILGNIVIPLLYKKDKISIYNFFDSIKKHLGQYIVIKKNSSQYGDGVKMLNLNNYKENNILNFLLNNYLNTGYESIYSIYITPYYEIKKEYRVYYIYNKKEDKIEIYSIKNRINEKICDIFQINNYTINKDIKVIWNYTLKKDFIKNKKNLDFVSKIAKKLKYDKGVIEFFENSNGNLIYSEINTLGALLMFKKDQNNMIQYYKNIWKIFMIKYIKEMSRTNSGHFFFYYDII